jgi:hypothetical protein
MTDRLPIPESVKWLQYDGNGALIVYNAEMPMDIHMDSCLCGSSDICNWCDLSSESKRFLAAVVEVEWLR